MPPVLDDTCFTERLVRVVPGTSFCLLRCCGVLLWCFPIDQQPQGAYHLGHVVDLSQPFIPRLCRHNNKMPSSITNLFWTASLLVQSSTSVPADQRHNKRRIRSPSHKDVTAENDDVFRHNFLDGEETDNSAPLPSARIVGGTETQPNRYPYMVSLQKVFARQTAGGTTLVFFAQKCGGTLIAEGESDRLVRRHTLQRRGNFLFPFVMPTLTHICKSFSSFSNYNFFTDIILTAAHCVDCADREDPDSCYDRIVLGRHDLRSYDEMKFVEQAGVFVGKSDGEDDYTTASTNSTANTTDSLFNEEESGRLKFDRSEVMTYLHPLYEKHHRTGAQYDFALIKLPTRVYNETATGGSLSPIQLNSDPTVPSNGQSLTIAGWGATRSSIHDTDSSSSSVSPVLLEAAVPYLNNDICRQVEGIVGSTFYSYKDIVNSCMMCAMSIGPDACSGDSGGPLFVRGPAEDGSHDVQVGIVSFGVECGNPNFPGVYARISEAYDWIGETVCSSSNYPADNFGCSPSESPSDRPSLRDSSDSPSLTPTAAPSMATSTPTSLPPSATPTMISTEERDSDRPSLDPSSKPSRSSTQAPTTVMDQIFLVPEKLERSGALQSQVLLAEMAEDELQVSARIEPNPPTAKPSSGPTAWIRTGLPSEQPVSRPNNMFGEMGLSSSGSPRAFIALPMLLVGTLASLALFFLP